MDIKKLLHKRRILIDRKLDAILPKETITPTKLHRAMRYSVFSGGKRIRPILAIESCLCCGGKISDVIDPACAIELAHTFSLIHDDLPAMDNDDYRRGRLTCHKKFGEAAAILAGDALLALAFKVLTMGRRPATQIALIKEFADSIGSLGVGGGQCVDIEYEGKKKDRRILDYINSHKTGTLIKASLKMGAIVANAPAKNINAMERFGAYIGETFQLIDDILDNGDSVVVFGKEGAYQMAEGLTRKAKETLDCFLDGADTLKTIADYLVERRF